MKILITGSKGFVGERLVRNLENKGHEVISMFRPSTTTARPLPPNGISKTRNVQCDMKNICDLPNLIEDRDIDACVHLAWGGISGKNRGDFDIQIDNIKDTINLIDSLSVMGVKKFVGIGTLAELDVLAYHLKNGSEPSSVSLYAVSKLSTLLMSKIKCNSLGISHVWCRLANAYGPGDFTSTFIISACEEITSKNKVSFTAGTQLYDFIYIDDAVEGVAIATEKGKNNNIYFVSSGEIRPLKEYVIDIKNTVKSNATLCFGDIPFKGISLNEEDFSMKELMDLGYRPKTPFKEGIKKTIEWLNESKQ